MANLVIKNNNNADVSLTFDRNTNASWRIVNSEGILYFQNDWTSAKGDYFNVLTLNYNTGNAVFKGTVTASSFIGNASSATKLTTDAGSSSKPVYFYGGIPVECGSSLAVAITGNAATASKWATSRTLSWIGDATGSMSIDGSDNTSATLTLAKSGVTAGSYGPSANASPAHSGTFSVPYFTVDAKGRVTSASTKTITLPAIYNLPVATSSTLGGVKSGTDITVDSSGNVSVNDDSHNHVISNIDNLQSSLDSKLSLSHDTSTSAHNDIRALIADLTTKLNNFLDVDDTTTDQLSEVLTLISNNKETLESLTTNKINVSDIINNLTTNSASKVLSAAQGVIIKALIDTLQTELDAHTHTVSHTPAGSISSKTLTPTGSVSSTFSGTAASHGHTFTGTKAILSVTHTPVGSVASTFTGTAASHNHTFTGTAASHNHTFTGSEATISISHTPAGSVSSTFTGSSATTGSPSTTATVASSTHTHKYTPAGTVSTPTFTGSAVTTGSPSGTTSVYSITSVGTAPSLAASVSNRCLTLTFSAGSVPTRSSVTLPSTTHTHSVTAAGSVSQPTFTGTETSTTSITGTTSVAGSVHTHAVTAKGSVSSSFTGTEATLSVDYTPSGSISSKSITPSGSIASTLITPKGSISSAFTGEEETLTVDYTPTGSISNTSITPKGSVSSTFTGTAASHNHAFTGTSATLTTSVPKE